MVYNEEEDESGNETKSVVYTFLSFVIMIVIALVFIVGFAFLF